MISDPIIVTEKSWRDSSIINEELKQNSQSIVLIGGISGVQKTECSECLQSRLYERGLTSFVVSLDDYYIVNVENREIWRKKFGIEKVGIEELDWLDLNRIIEDFKRKKKNFISEERINMLRLLKKTQLQVQK